MTETSGPPVPNNDLSSLRAPKALRADVAEIAALIDAVCVEHLDDEYGTLSHRLLAKLARKRPSPLARGERRVWAAAASTPSAASTSSSTRANRRTCALTCSLRPPGSRSRPWPTSRP